jgi:hypothetical protein
MQYVNEACLTIGDPFILYPTPYYKNLLTSRITAKFLDNSIFEYHPGIDY